jgi:hypothetical protein
LSANLVGCVVAVDVTLPMWRRGKLGAGNASSTSSCNFAFPLLIHPRPLYIDLHGLDSATPVSPSPRFASHHVSISAGSVHASFPPGIRSPTFASLQITHHRLPLAFLCLFHTFQIDVDSLQVIPRIFQNRQHPRFVLTLSRCLHFHTTSHTRRVVAGWHSHREWAR